MLHENIIHNIFLPNPKPLVKLALRVLIHLNIILSGVTKMNLTGQARSIDSVLADSTEMVRKMRCSFFMLRQTLALIR